MWRNGNPLTLQVGASNGKAMLEESWVVSESVKHTFTIWSSNATTCPPERNKNIRPHKHLYPMFTAELFIELQSGNNQNVHPLKSG